MAKVLSSQEEFGQWLLEFLPQLLDPEYDLQPGEVRHTLQGDCDDHAAGSGQN